MTRSGVSIVVPVFESLETLTNLVDRTLATLAESRQVEIVLVDDGSGGTTWEHVARLTSLHPEVRGIRFSRNFGQHSALVAGVRAASLPITVTIDDDLQNPPEEIPRLLEQLESGQFDVVYGVPKHVEQSLGRRLAGRITRIGLGSGLGIDAATSVSSFRAFWTDSRDAFNADLGPNVSLDALLSWGNSRFGSVTVKHAARTVGKSNYSFGKLLAFAVDTATGYSSLPLQVASVMGMFTAAVGFLLLLWIVGRPLVTGESIPGFPFLASTIAIFSGVQLLTLGVIGEYVARIHFRIMRKPTYVVGETTDGANDSGSARSSQ